MKSYFKRSSYHKYGFVTVVLHKCGEKINTDGRVTHIFLIIAPFRFYTHLFLKFLLKLRENCIFQLSDTYNF